MSIASESLSWQLGASSDYVWRRWFPVVEGCCEYEYIE
jgi:hypothetical protein